MKVFYIGSAGTLSLQPLDYLLSVGHDVCGVGLDKQGPTATLLMQARESIDSRARLAGTPVVDLRQPAAAVIAAVIRLNPDMILVSCYVRRLVDELLKLPRLGAFNIHPSLLPAFRGPMPLFWQFRAGVRQFGVSLHRMTTAFDAGPVIGCRQTLMPDGTTLAQAGNRLTEQVPALLEEGLAAIRRGDDGIEQDEAMASYQSCPTVDDFTISADWSARRAFNFMRATAHMGQPYACETEGRVVRLRHALAYSSGDAAELSGAEERVIISFSTGVLVASCYQ